MIGLEAVQITPQLLRQISAIDEFKGYWRGVEEHTTGLKLIGDVAHHGGEFKRLWGALQGQAIKPAIICALHGVVAGDKKPTAFRTGDYRLSIFDGQEEVGALETAAPDSIAVFLDKLCAWGNDALTRGEIHPLIVVSVFTAVFLQISPFDEGNVKVARFLVMLMMLKAGYAYAPYSLLDQPMTERGVEIYAALKANQDSLDAGRPDWSAWLSCFMGLLLEQKEAMHARMGGAGQALDIKDLPALSLKLLDLVRGKRRLSMKEAIQLTGGRRSTIKLRLAELVDAGMIKRHGKARSTWYSLS